MFLIDRQWSRKHEYLEVTNYQEKIEEVYSPLLEQNMSDSQMLPCREIEKLLEPCCCLDSSLRKQWDSQHSRCPTNVLRMYAAMRVL
jgi:hypothetical protein